MSMTQQAFTLAQQYQTQPSTQLVVVKDCVEAAALSASLAFFLGEDSRQLLTFPDWETLIYDFFSPHEDLVSERLETLYRLGQGEAGIVVVPVSALLQRVCPKSHVFKQALILAEGQTLSIERLVENAIEAGYQRVTEVRVHGEMAVRGAIVDLYPMGLDWPVRVEFDWDQIASLRQFEPDTQNTLHKQSKIQLLPASECDCSQAGQARFDAAFRTHFPVNPRKVPLYEAVMRGGKPPGIGYYLPLFFEETAHFLDYLPENTRVFRGEGIEPAAQQLWQEAKARYEQYSADLSRPILPPQALLFSVSETFERLNRFQQQRLSTQVDIGFSIPELPNVSQAEASLRALLDYLQTSSDRLVLALSSNRRLHWLQNELIDKGLKPVVYSDWADCVTHSAQVGLILEPIASAHLPTLGLRIISEDQLFNTGPIPSHRYRKRQQQTRSEHAISDYLELKPGDAVVHVKHGIGLYEGLTQLEIDGVPGEYCQLLYDQAARLYIPVSELQQISRYTGITEELKLSSLGSLRWRKAQQEAIQKAGDLAANLLQIQAKRQANVLPALSWDPKLYEQFVSAFPFEETPDQLNAIQAVLQDLQATFPMDRVICGDVGFGKTEVALRAAFAVIAAGKQVALLAPTTLLVEQHRQTFQDRFAAFPIRIESLSRFQSPKTQKAIIADLKAGKVDLVIGTHKLLQADVGFANLGLLIIDEEHRFGVKQKSVFRAWRGQVHCLALTATPIPRTLHMAMGGLRDLSIMSTPPLKRLAVKTLVMPYSTAIAKEAILREHQRGGQVYYLYNEVEGIEQRAANIQAWFPHIKVGVAHGQMRELELERVMADFYHQRFGILVCTTIIETGIDVPSANTIVIERADKLGLAQLHQLRGRVGRSHHQAYAYCFTPAEQTLKKDAAKRLEALSSASELGAGFQLATQDLEIRGAGALLGEAQSGDIQSVGFSLYQRLLEKAVKALKSGKSLSLEDFDQDFAELQLDLPAFIPEEYVADVSLRLRLYKALSDTQGEASRQALAASWRDRFGPLPEPVEQLFFLQACRETMQSLGITRIDLQAQGGILEVANDNRLDPQCLLRWMREAPQVYQLAGPNRLKIKQDLRDPMARRDFLQRLLNELGSSTQH